MGLFEPKPWNKLSRRDEQKLAARAEKERWARKREQAKRLADLERAAKKKRK